MTREGGSSSRFSGPSGYLGEGTANGPGSSHPIVGLRKARLRVQPRISSGPSRRPGAFGLVVAVDRATCTPTASRGGRLTSAMTKAKSRRTEGKIGP